MCWVAGHYVKHVFECNIFYIRRKVTCTVFQIKVKGDPDDVGKYI